GGGTYTVDISPAGKAYRPVQRTVKTRWNDYAVLRDVVITPTGPFMTWQGGTPGCAMGSPAVCFPVLQSALIGAPAVTDSDGSRAAYAYFAPATTVAVDNTSYTGNLTFKATEFTVGPAGPSAMPGDLPPPSIYTYALDVSADEADKKTLSF